MLSENLASAIRIARYIQWVPNAERLAANVLKNSSADAIDQEIVRKVLGSTRYRLTATHGLTINPRLSGTEKTGVVMFIGLVNCADDIVDGDRRRYANPKELEEFLLSQPAGLKISSPPTILEFKDRVLAKFPQSKQDIVNNFLQEALAVEVNDRNKDHNAYTFADAVEYRERTAKEYARASALLAGMTDTKALAGFEAFAMAIQILDDCVDWPHDIGFGIRTPVTEMARMQGEINKLQAIASQIRTSVGRKALLKNEEEDRFGLKSAHAREGILQLPATQSGMREYLEVVIGQTHTAPVRYVLSKMGNYLMGDPGIGENMMRLLDFYQESNSRRVRR